MKYFIVALVCCVAFRVSGQEIQWGRLQQKPDKNIQVSEVIGQSSAGIFTLLTDVRIPAILPPFLQRFNADLKMEKQVPLRLRSKYGNLTLEKVVILDNHLYAIGSVSSQGARVRACVQEIDLETLQPKHEPRLISEVNWVEGLMDVSLGIKISADRSKVLIYNYFPATAENSSRNWFLVFDAQMKCLWSNSADATQLDKDLLLLDYEITNLGEVMVLTKEKQKANEGLNLAILQYEDKAQKPSQYDLRLGQVQLQNANLELDNQGRLICAGLLNDGYNETTGAFASVIDPNSGTVKTQLNHFNPTELGSLNGSPKRLFDYQPRAFQVTSTGRIIILAEQFLPPSFTRNNQPYYGQVLVVNYPRDLSSPYISKLDKSQASFDRGYFDSFAFLAKAEQHLLLYNDNGKSPMRTVSFTAKGMENTTLDPPGSDKLKVCPRNCAALSDEILWIYAETADKKHYQVGLLKF